MDDPPPLSGVTVLDFTTLAPGPIATLILARAGAEVIKIERPDGGDELRAYRPRLGAEGAWFALLNAGKRSVAIDLKAPGARARLAPLLARADIVVEPFRPGVMARLGLGFADLAARHPGLIYCSITGHGQIGPKASRAGHDLNFMAESGLLGLAAGTDGAPVVPPGLIADVGGGAQPAVIAILLALRQREATGRGRHLDIAMADHLWPFAFWALANAGVGKPSPPPGASLLTGGSPRYQIYPTADRHHLAAAPLEQRFWDRFCALIELEPALRDDRQDPEATRQRVASIIASQPAGHWQARLAGHDVCCSIVATWETALADPEIAARGLLARRLATVDGRTMPAMPLPGDPAPHDQVVDRVPALGEANQEFLAPAGDDRR